MKHQAVIVSLYPAAFYAQRSAFFPQREYRILRCTDFSKPQVCVVETQTERNIYIALGRTTERTWDAHEVARDVMNEWASGALGTSLEQGAIPALWISDRAAFVNGEWVIPQDEIDFHRRQQDGVLRRLVQLGRLLFEKKNEPLPVMRHAAEMLKIKGESWQVEVTSDSRVQCKWCSEVNASTNPICHNCHRIINKTLHDQIEREMAEQERALSPDGAIPTVEEEQAAINLAAATQREAPASNKLGAPLKGKAA